MPYISLDFPGGSEGKVSVCNARDPGSIPGSGRSPGEGNGNPLQYSCLENPLDGAAWQARVHGVTKSRTRLSDFSFTLYISLLLSDGSAFLKTCLCLISCCSSVQCIASFRQQPDISLLYYYTLALVDPWLESQVTKGKIDQLISSENPLQRVLPQRSQSQMTFCHL